MLKPPFFSKNDLGRVAKCLGGQLKEFLPVTNKELLKVFYHLYPVIASQLLGKPVTVVDLATAYTWATNRVLTDSTLLQRFDKYKRYAEVDPVFASQVKTAFTALLVIPTKSRPGPVRPLTQTVTPAVTPITTTKSESLVTVQRVSRFLKLSKSAVYRLARIGRLPAHRIGKTVRFRLSEVADQIK